MERMKKKVWRRRLAAWLIVSLCAGLCPAPVAATAAEPETVAQEETKDIEQSPEEAETEEDTAWEDEEVVVEVDENGKDEWGNYFWTSTTQVGFDIDARKLTKNKKGNYEVRVPDKVIKAGKEYTVTEYSVNNTWQMENDAAYEIYVGKSIDAITRANYRETFHVHHDNKNYLSEKGSVFTKGKQILVSFDSSAYARDAVYEIPETVMALSDYAFHGAKIKEVVLNNKLKKIPSCCFSGASIKRMDLKNVTKLETFAFSDCRYLKELKINCEGFIIGEGALDGTTNLKNLYIPPNTEFSQYTNFENNELNALIIDENVDVSNLKNTIFTGTNLETIVLPRNMQKIGGGMSIHDVPKLTKLYIPDSVEEIEPGALNAKGNLKIYAKRTSPAADYDDDNVTFVSWDGHKHQLEEVTFFQYETWGVKGKYCRECAYAEEIKKVDFQTEEDRKNMPELLVYEHECPKMLELDDANTDEQGIIYEFDDIYQTATVAKLDYSRPFPKSIFLIPEKVRKDGKEYVVDTIGDDSLNNAIVVVLPDTIKTIGAWLFQSNLYEITLGKNVKKIASDAFTQCNPHIKIRGENPYFKIVDNVLYDSKMTRLIKYMCDCDREEYTIPKTVSKIEQDAFLNVTALKKIIVYNRKYIEDSALDDMKACNVEIVEREDLSALPTKVSEEPEANEYSWEGDDLEVELNSKYEDSYGNYYNLDGDTKTATLYKIEENVFESDANEVTIRIPDKVKKAGRAYTVTQIQGFQWHDTDEGQQKSINLYIGKYMENINLGDEYCKIVSYVHAENKDYISKKGCLFSFDQTWLYRFCDKELKGISYTIPSKVQDVCKNAFYGTDIKKVIFNEKIDTVQENTFRNSSVETVVMSNVECIREYSFRNCVNLKEIILNDEGVHIYPFAFLNTKNLKNVYIPEKSVIANSAFCESGVQNIVFAKSARFWGTGSESSMDNTFLRCVDLRNIILPEGVSAIERFTFFGCDNLDKFYIPESVTNIEEKTFRGNTINVYGQEGSAAEAIQDENVNFISLKDHKHNYKNITFFSFDKWAVTGDYCEQCGSGTNIKKISWTKGGEKELPDQLAIQPASHKCPVKRSLDNENTDEYGVIYKVDPSTMTATVKCVNTKKCESRIQYCLYIPENVERDGKVFRVTKLGNSAISGTLHIILPDTIETLEKYCIYSSGLNIGTGSQEMNIELGSGIKNIDDKAFSATHGQVSIRYRNGVTGGKLICDNGIVMSADKTKLYKYCAYRTGEYTIPSSVKYIMANAFTGNGNDTGLTQINVPKRKNLIIDANAFDDCDAYINYIDVDDSNIVVTPTASPTVAPTSSPTASPTRQPSASPSVLPIPSPVISPEPVTMPTFVPDLTAVFNPSQPAQIPESSSDTTKNEKPDLTIRGFRLTSREKRVSITWNRCTNAEFYRIYRAEKNGKYQLIQVLTSIKTSYVDNNVKPAKRYFYKIRAVGNENGVLQEGAEKRLSITLSGLEKPVIKVKKGKTDLVRYISVILKKYGGTHAQVYMSLNGKKYTKLKMTSDKIAKFRGTFRFQCKLRRKVLWLKVRTYKRNKKGRTYSGFSKAAKIRV